ncbi:MAG: nucleotidyltransferase family protein [Acidobacteriales bacterium]|nr:nucleotidyltransferase family protein [Terriglobales bacterium]
MAANYHAPTPEAELLLLCAKRKWDVGSVQDLLTCVTDWDSVLKLAGRHGLAPMLYWRLKDEHAARVPAEVFTRLRTSYLHALRRGILYERELIRILDLLDSRGIDAVGYKGPLLAAMTQQQVGLRDFVDLDILIRKRDLPRIFEALGEIGYRPQRDLNPSQWKALLRFDYEAPMARPSDGSLLDLQWASPPRFLSLPVGPNVEDARYATVKLGGREFRTLCTEDLLLVLCSHGAKHVWDRLQWLADVAGIIETSPALDWDAVLDRAARWRRHRMLMLGLALAHDLLETPLPERVLRGIQAERAVGQLARAVRERLFDPYAGETGVLRMARFHAEAMDRWRDAAVYLLRLSATPTPGDWGAVTLPEWLMAGYYVVRPVRFFVQYVFGRRSL